MSWYLRLMWPGQQEPPTGPRLALWAVNTIQEEWDSLSPPPSGSHCMDWDGGRGKGAMIKAPPTILSPEKKSTSTNPGKPESTVEVPSPLGAPYGALMEMRLSAPPRARFLRDLLMLTLLLGAVCGVPMETSQSFSVQARNHPEQAEGGDNVVANEALPVESRTPEDTGDIKQEGSARKPGMRNRKNQGPDPEVPDIDNKSDGDTCDKWMSCNRDFFLQYLNFVELELPSCPCVYPPFAIHSTVPVFDERLGRWFQWKDASDSEDLLPVYQPSASLCLRSLLPENSSTLASQHCCYDGRHRLLTRGKGAGTPKLISPDYSPDLHFMVERFPWVFCKGDWSRVHKVLPPNNGLDCPQRPSNQVYQAQLQEASKS